MLLDLSDARCRAATYALRPDADRQASATVHELSGLALGTSAEQHTGWSAHLRRRFELRLKSRRNG